MWWNLRAHSFDNAKVLSGGYKKWLAEGLPTKSSDERCRAASFESNPRDGLIFGKDVVLAGIDEPNTALLSTL
jgi:thiosulfate/3-mercaptopyruvate sulfurtransferase